MVAATAYAAGIVSWTRSDVEDANRLFRDRSGLQFAVEPPPDPDRGQTLVVHARPVADREQSIVVRAPGTDAFPPGPCMVAHLMPPGPPVRVAVTVLAPDQIAFSASDGTPLSLCDANGGGVTIPTN